MKDTKNLKFLHFCISMLLFTSSVFSRVLKHTPSKSKIPERILQIQQGFNEKYDTEHFLKQLDTQLNNLDTVDEKIKDFKLWVTKKTDNILYHMEHDTDMTTPNLMIKMMYAKKMIEVIRSFTNYI